MTLTWMVIIVQFHVNVNVSVNAFNSQRMLTVQSRNRNRHRHRTADAGIGVGINRYGYRPASPVASCCVFDVNHDLTHVRKEQAFVDNHNDKNNNISNNNNNSCSCSCADMKQPLQRGAVLFKGQQQQQQSLLLPMKHNSAVAPLSLLLNGSILRSISSIITKLQLAISTSTHTHTLKSILTTIATTITNTNRKTITKSIIKLTFLLLTFHTIRDIIQTNKRQCIDPTSEWGRYADYPSIRGKALFVLMMKMLLWIIVARVVNSFPGGDHFSLWNNNNKKKKKLKISSSSISSDNDNDSSNEINNDGNISSAAWASRKATKIRQHSGEKLADGLLKLGPLYIKIGQIISCRDKLLPDEWKKALERLQDRVPAKSGKEAYYVPSIKISDDDKLNEAGVTLQDREYLAECLARAYLRQFCVNKFFSTDPHPGNLGVEIVKNDNNNDNEKPTF